MKPLTAVFVALFLATAAPSALADVIKMSVGKAVVPGTVSFTLWAGEDSLAVSVDLGPMSAAAKAAALADAVGAQDPSGTWRAVASAATVSFEHSVGGVFGPADTITAITDTTGAGTGLGKVGDTAKFKLYMDADAEATGVDAEGKASFITVSLTDTLAWTHALAAGETAEQVMDQFYTFLLDEGGAGVTVTRKNATYLEIELSYDSSSFSWQITDTGLQPRAQGGGRDAGVIDR